MAKSSLPRRKLLSARGAGLSGVAIAIASLGYSASPTAFAADDAADARAAATAKAVAAAEERLLSSVKYLSSDDLEGRGIGTKGIDAAAYYLAGEFTKLSLRTDAVDGTPFQKFKISLRTQLGAKENNRLALTGANKDGKEEKIELELGKSFTPMAIGGSATFDLPLVFAGYGISAKDEGYDDYEGVDVKDKAVIVLRHNPQLDKPGGAFTAGHGPSRHAYFDAKVSNAYQHGAALVILVNDDADIQKQVDSQRKRWLDAIDKLAAAHAKFKETKEPSDEQLQKHREEVQKLTADINKYNEQWQAQVDPLLEFERAGTDNGGRKMPVVFCTRAMIDRVLQAQLGKNLAALEREIDTGATGSTSEANAAPAASEPKASEPEDKDKDKKDDEKPKLPKPIPRSVALGSWKAAGETSVTREDAECKNVIAVLEGEGPLADETVVIGAHYDHLGRGGAGSLARGSTDIHNGADDNASGSAALLEVARALATAEKKPRRRIVFMAFSAEERGLIGSAYYVNNPVFPLDKTVAMLNMDMVGRVADNKLIVQGADTATEFKPWVETANEIAAFKITHQSGGFGPSDHASFYPKKIPVMHFFTGLHSDYHRPSDDFDRIDVPGMRRVVEMVTYVATQTAENPTRPAYVESKQPAPRNRRDGSGSPSGARPYFGSVPDFGEPTDGFAISGVTKDGPAEKGGLKGGDVITYLGDNKIGNLEDFDAALRKFKSGDTIVVTVRRGKEELKLNVKVEDPR